MKPQAPHIWAEDDRCEVCAMHKAWPGARYACGNVRQPKKPMRERELPLEIGTNVGTHVIVALVGGKYTAECKKCGDRIKRSRGAIVASFCAKCSKPKR